MTYRPHAVTAPGWNDEPFCYLDGASGNQDGAKWRKNGVKPFPAMQLHWCRRALPARLSAGVPITVS